MHWADFVAGKLSRPTKSGSQNNIIIAAGITPSGEFHIGHLREILTCDLIYRACRNFSWTSGNRYEEFQGILRGLGITEEEWTYARELAISQEELVLDFIFIVDSADPLRKVYPFLDQSYEQFIGHQLGKIPPPNADGKPDYVRFENGESYADHFLAPFIQALKKIGVRPRIVDNLKCYENGEFAECIDIACSNVEKLKDIITKVSGRELPEDWFPFNPVGSDGSMDGVKVTGYEYPFVSWMDNHGESGQSDIRKGEGKLPWRIEWPAKWAIHGVTCEPFGKDHGASGGSFDTGKKIAPLFNIKAPYDLTYEWISLKGVGAMSSSVGTTIGPLEVLEIVPPEIVRYLIARNQPRRHIEFDTGTSLIELADEYQRNCSELAKGEPENYDSMSKRQQKAWVVQINQIAYSQVYDLTFGGFTGEAWDEEVSQAASDTHIASFRHLALLAQLFENDADVWESLRKSGMIDSSFDLLMEFGNQNISSEYYIKNGVVHSRDGFDYEQYLLENAAIAKEVDGKKQWDMSIEETVWNHHYQEQISLGMKVGRTSTLPIRLKTIRNWIKSPHFPEGFRLRIQSDISPAAKENMDSRDYNYLFDLISDLEDCIWNADEINDSICNQAKKNGMNIGDAFQLLYWIFLDQKYGPKLASILSEMERVDVVSLLKLAVNELSS